MNHSDAEGWSIGDRSIVFHARRWQVERSLRTRAGQQQQHEFFTIRIPDFVHVVALTARDELVLVRQFRHGIEGFTLELPGGLLDPGEPDPGVAGARELEEETGLRAVGLEPLGAVRPNPALLNNRCWFYLAQGCAQTGRQQLEATEDIRVLLVPRREVPAMIADGRLDNALVIAGLHLAMAHPAWRG